MQRYKQINKHGFHCSHYLNLRVFVKMYNLWPSYRNVSLYRQIFSCVGEGSSPVSTIPHPQALLLSVAWAFDGNCCCSIVFVRCVYLLHNII